MKDEGTVSLHDDPSFHVYLQTLLEFSGNVGTIDLRVRLSDQQRAQLQIDIHKEFAVVTPCNPVGLTVAEHVNTDRIAAFRSELGAERLSHWPCMGRSPDGEHREQGNAIAECKTNAVDRARRWQQAAIFWFDGQFFWLVPVLMDASPVRLPQA